MVNRYLKYSTIKLSTLIELDETGDLSSLLTEGEFNEDEARLEYQTILEKYRAAIQQGQSAKIYLEENREIKLHARLNVLMGLRLLWYIDEEYTLEFIEREKLNIKNVTDLDIKANNLAVKLKLSQMKSKPTKGKEKKKVDSKEPVKFGWANLLSSLLVYQNITLNPETTTLSLLAEVIKTVQKKIKDGRSNNRKSRTR